MEENKKIKWWYAQRQWSCHQIMDRVPYKSYVRWNREVMIHHMRQSTIPPFTVDINSNPVQNILRFTIFGSISDWFGIIDLRICERNHRVHDWSVDEYIAWRFGFKEDMEGTNASSAWKGMLDDSIEGRNVMRLNDWWFWELWYETDRLLTADRIRLPLRHEQEVEHTNKSTEFCTHRKTAVDVGIGHQGKYLHQKNQHKCVAAYTVSFLNSV